RERRYRVANLKLAADAEARERIGRAAAGQIDRWQRPPAHRRIEEIASARAHHELLVDGLLADLHVERVAKFLIVPELPEPQRPVCLDAGQRLQGDEVGLGQIAAPDMEAADVERAAREAERLPGVEIQLHQGLPVAAEAPLGPARYIAEHLRVFGNAESEADFLNSGPKPAEVAEEVLAVRRAAEHA